MRPLVWLSLLAAALVLRLMCLHSELWLDEILSLNLSRDVTSPFSAFALRNDNNHLLNTLWLALWPADAAPWQLRLHSLAAGVAAVFLMGVAGRRLAAETPALILGAGSWWLVLASADARGYSLTVAAALAAFLALDGYLARPRWAMLVGFWAAVVVAFLSHLTFLHAYLGLITWSARGGTAREQVRRLVLLHAVPGVFLVTLYLGFLRGLEVEGGPPAEIGRTLLSLVSRGLGGPGEGWATIKYVLLGVALFGVGLASVARSGDGVWVFFLVTCVVVPGVFLLNRPAILFERYFLVSFAFFLLMVARALADLWKRFPLGAAAFLVVFAVGSLRTADEYAKAGRGNFSAIARQLEAEGGSVTSDDDFQVGTYLKHFAPEIPLVSTKHVPAGGADWLIVHRYDDRYPPGDEYRDSADNVYDRPVKYPSAGPAGWGWFLYRNSKVRPPR